VSLPAGLVIRPFARTDAESLGGIWLRGFADGVPGVQPAHSDAEVRHYMGMVLPERAEVWVAALDEVPVAFLALHAGWVEQLYVDPPHIRRGIGRALLTLAQDRNPTGLQLWAFEVNGRAQRFYEAHGFVAVERTDGSGNEEQAPDVRFAWRGRA
jgi:GNAT superfamily N-acetyltransferase